MNHADANAQSILAGNKHFVLINTAYPPDKSNWLSYRAEPDYASWDTEVGFGFYIHIPFCKTRCRFCEYVTMPLPDADVVGQYIRALARELDFYESRCGFASKILHGFDIGGGTPTLLKEKQLESLFAFVAPFIDRMNRAPDYEQGIETNAEIACLEPGLFKVYPEYGFTRISMGVQTINQGLLAGLNRGYQAELAYNTAVDHLRKAGFKKINLDVMYGLPGQDFRAWEESLNFVLALHPDQISIYETRYKDSVLYPEHRQLNLHELNRMYDFAYSCLNSAGYFACYGSTAFTKNAADYGLSSYLRKRTTDFIPYLGLGIGAQSMTRAYLSYNTGKNSFDLAGYMAGVAKGEPVEYFYKLPLEETAAKYIAIAFYLGFINYELLEKRLSIDFFALYKAQLDFLFAQGWVRQEQGKLLLTPAGYEQWHGIVALFYPPNTREYLFALA